jgi:hypothetical protein
VRAPPRDQDDTLGIRLQEITTVRPWSREDRASALRRLHRPRRVPAALRELLLQAGVEAAIEQRRVKSDADAQRMRFLGSPTLRVDSVDVDPSAGERGDFGMKCRLYPTAEGLRGAPRDEWVLAALRRGAAAASGPGACACRDRQGGSTARGTAGILSS